MPRPGREPVRSASAANLDGQASLHGREGLQVKIKSITFQLRNDFSAILECEHCTATQTLKSGYNDPYYHNKVIPAIKCNKCGKVRESEAA
jgi:hypothetical protein